VTVQRRVNTKIEGRKPCEDGVRVDAARSKEPNMTGGLKSVH
jgi:hypothetical protein